MLLSKVSWLTRFVINKHHSPSSFTQHILESSWSPEYVVDVNLCPNKTLNNAFSSFQLCPHQHSKIFFLFCQGSYFHCDNWRKAENFSALPTSLTFALQIVGIVLFFENLSLVWINQFSLYMYILYIYIYIFA